MGIYALVLICVLCIIHPQYSKSIYFRTLTPFLIYAYPVELFFKLHVINTSQKHTSDTRDKTPRKNTLEGLIDKEPMAHFRHLRQIPE